MKPFMMLSNLDENDPYSDLIAKCETEAIAGKDVMFTKAYLEHFKKEAK